MVHIRQAKDSDLDYIVSFVKKLSTFNRKNHSITSKYDDHEPVLRAIAERTQTAFRNRDESSLFLIAEDNQSPIGYVFAKIYEETQVADNGTGKMGLLADLFVDEAARGIGLGQTLIDKTMEWFRSKGIRRVKLHAYSWNKAALKVYEKNGFAEYAVSYEKFI